MADIAALQPSANPVLANLCLAAWGPLLLDGAMRAESKSAGDSVANSPNEMLAAIARDRDRGAFMALFRHFAPRVKAYLVRLGAERSAADDLVQDVMLTVWHRAVQFAPGKASASTWIFTIARNRRIDVLRRERRPQIDADDPALVQDTDDPGDRVVELKQRSRLLRQAMTSLPEEQASLLRLAFFEDKSHSAIAEQLTLPLGTVKSRLRLAMTKLRSALKDLQ